MSMCERTSLLVLNGALATLTTGRCAEKTLSVYGLHGECLDCAEKAALTNIVRQFVDFFCGAERGGFADRAFSPTKVNTIGWL
eukprot:5173633-Prymnesium_polylepis.1